MLNTGNFKFLENKMLHPKELDIKTRFNEKIDNWIQERETHMFLDVLSITHKYTHPSKEIGMKGFAAIILPYLAQACNKIFLPALKKEVRASLKNLPPL